jgi:predicted Fe-Mo cluster-binding NifX family protein
MIRVAIPTFQNRVAPVIDSCRHILIVDIVAGSEIQRENIFLGHISMSERCSVLRKMGVSVVICGGISETCARMLKSFDVRLINGIAGQVDDVLTAFIGDHIDNPSFYMPGFKAIDKA